VASLGCHANCKENRICCPICLLLLFVTLIVSVLSMPVAVAFIEAMCLKRVLRTDRPFGRVGPFNPPPGDEINFEMHQRLFHPVIRSKPVLPRPRNRETTLSIFGIHCLYFLLERTYLKTKLRISSVRFQLIYFSFQIASYSILKIPIIIILATRKLWKV
jgi:hypothetical protein